MKCKIIRKFDKELIVQTWTIKYINEHLLHLVKFLTLMLLSMDFICLSKNLSSEPNVEDSCARTPWNLYIFTNLNENLSIRTFFETGFGDPNVCGSMYRACYARSGRFLQKKKFEFM